MPALRQHYFTYLIYISLYVRITVRTCIYIMYNIMMCINKSSVAMYIHVHVGDVQQRSMQRLT